MGDGLPAAEIFRPRRARRGRGPAAPPLRARPDSPRLLGAFNEATPDWLAFFMFTFFTDRDGKMQLHALAQSGFDPLVAHLPLHADRGSAPHVRRPDRGRPHHRAHLRRDAEAGIDDPTDIERVRALGVIDLPTIQKRINLHFSLTLDLFGNEVSTNAANAFNAGLKGRYLEDQIDDDHRLVDATYPVLASADGGSSARTAPALSALNMRLRDDYVADARSASSAGGTASSPSAPAFE